LACRRRRPSCNLICPAVPGRREYGLHDRPG
jgi:hypothetical protein